MKDNEVTMWVARDKNDDLYLYRDKPRKDSRLERWMDEVDYCVFFIDPDLFPSVKWEDAEPTEVVLTLKNRV